MKNICFISLSYLWVVTSAFLHTAVPGLNPRAMIYFTCQFLSPPRFQGRMRHSSAIPIDSDGIMWTPALEFFTVNNTFDSEIPDRVFAQYRHSQHES